MHKAGRRLSPATTEPSNNESHRWRHQAKSTTLKKGFQVLWYSAQIRTKALPSPQKSTLQPSLPPITIFHLNRAKTSCRLFLFNKQRRKRGKEKEENKRWKMKSENHKLPWNTYQWSTGANLRHWFAFKSHPQIGDISSTPWTTRESFWLFFFIHLSLLSSLFFLLSSLSLSLSLSLLSLLPPSKWSMSAAQPSPFNASIYSASPWRPHLFSLLGCIGSLRSSASRVLVESFSIQKAALSLRKYRGERSEETRRRKKKGSEA